MTTAFSPATVVFTFAFHLFPFSLLAQQPAPPASQQQTEKCAVEGVVLKAATREPLKNARVVLQTVEWHDPPLGTLTDAAGRFSLREVPPGRYTLSVERTGYVRQEYGQRSWNRPGSVLTLEPGQKLTDLTFRLLPAAAISGRVRDADGEPIANARLQVLRYTYWRGQRVLMPLGGATSNDLGEYRIHTLAPGRYYLVADHSARFKLAEKGISQRPGDAGREEGYAPIYYPGTADRARAAPLELHPGEELSSIDFTIAPVPTVRIRGRVSNGVTGQPGRGAEVRLVTRDLSPSGLFRNHAAVENPQGTFELRGVTSGSYVLTAVWSEAGKTYAARELIEVGSADVEGISLVIAPGVDSVGRVRVEGDAQIKFTDLHIFLRPREDPIAAGGTSVGLDGAFALRNLPPGTYRVDVAGLPSDFYVKAVRLGSQDVLESGLNFLRGQPGDTLEVLLSPAGGRLDGVVLDAEHLPASGATVTFVPESRRRSDPGLYKTATTDQLGRFSLRGIAPGEYKLFAWDDLEPGAIPDPEILGPFEERGKILRIEASSQQSLELKLIRTDAGASPELW